MSLLSFATLCAERAREGLPAPGLNAGGATPAAGADTRAMPFETRARITSYNVCYTKLLRPDHGVLGRLDQGLGGLAAPVGEQMREPAPEGAHGQVVLRAVREGGLEPARALA